MAVGRGLLDQNQARLVGAMVFALTAPNVFLVFHGPVARLLGVLGAALGSVGAMLLVEMLQTGQIFAALGIIGFGVAVGVAGGYAHHRREKQKRADKTAAIAAAKDALARAHSTLYARFAALSGNAKSQEAPIHMLPFAQHLAHGVLWEASTEDDAEAMGRASARRPADLARRPDRQPGLRSPGLRRPGHGRLPRRGARGRGTATRRRGPPHRRSAARPYRLIRFPSSLFHAVPPVPAPPGEDFLTASGGFSVSGHDRGEIPS